jgi:hypothetical protein
VPVAGRWGLEMRSRFLGMSGVKVLIIVVVLLPGAEEKKLGI